MAPKNKPKNNNKPKNTPSNNTKRHDHSDPSQSGVNKTSNNNTMSEPNVGRSLNSNNGTNNNNIRRNTSTSSITSTDSNSSNDGSNSPLPHQRRTTNPNLKKNNPSNNNSNSNLSPTSPSSHQTKRKQHIPPPLNTNLTPKPSERIELIWTCLKSPLKPPVRGFHSCTLVNDKLYIIGGDNRVEHFKDICIYDLKTNYWIKLSENSHLPAPRTGHSAVLYQDKLYLFGGKNENYYTSDLFIYDLREKVWIKDSQPHNKKTNLTPRAAHSCCCVDDKMYIFGGITSYQANDGRKASEYIDVLSMYDISQRKWKKPKNKGTAPSARAGHSCCVINRDIYIFGGRQGTILFNDLYKYNVDSEKWSKVQTKGEAPQPSAGHTMSAYADKIVILGGSDWKKYPTEIYVFHIPSKVWVKCASLGITSGRFWHTATVYDENLYVYGGGTAELIDDIYSINLRSLNNISEATALTPQSSASPIPMPEIAVPTQTSTLKFKTIYKAEMRVFAKVPRDVTYLELKETISKSYGFPVVLKYVELDDEKDEITIKSDQELRDFIECFEEMGKGLRLELSEEKGHNYDSESDTEIDQEEMQPSSDGIKWRKGGLLGKGAYGEVYKGLNVNTGQWMAVKIIDLSATSEKEQKIVEKQIFNEINLMKDLCHENIVRYLGAEFNRKRTRLFIYIELVDGGSLSEILKNVGQLDESVVRQYTRQILFGLKYLHDKNIIHRDIKGGNILIETKSGTIKLADFGHSKKITENVQTSIRICGTPMWMAPEIIKESKYSKASDIWSVACTVIEMLTAEVPFPDLVSLENTGVMFKIATGATPKVPDNLSEEGKIFLAKCFHQNPALRPSVDDLLHEPFLRTLRYVGSSYPNDETSSEEEEEEDDESFPSLDDSDYEEDSNSFDKGKRPISTGSEEFEGMESPTPNNKGKGPLIQEEEDEEEDFTDEDEDEDEEDFSDDESESSSYSEDKSSQSITQQLRNIQANNPILSMGLRGNLPTQSQVAHIAQLRRAPPPPLVSTPSTGTLRGVLRNDINQMNPYIAQTVTQVASTPSGTLNIGSSTSHSKSDTKSACDNDVMSFLQTKNQSTQ